uniref:Uncharacterized protein n=4 Tax=Oryza TaxID=4527 RepID=A0A0D9YVX6_9ORYZ
MEGTDDPDPERQRSSSVAPAPPRRLRWQPPIGPCLPRAPTKRRSLWKELQQANSMVDLYNETRSHSETARRGALPVDQAFGLVMQPTPICDAADAVAC